MKKISAFFIILLLAFGLTAHAQQFINYQGVARDIAGNILINQPITLRLSILSGSASGTAAYIETHARSTDAYGLFTLQIGQGTVVTGVFNNIAWSSSSFFLKVEIDPTGGTNYGLAGTTQFAAVPYALNAKNGTPIGQNPGDMLYWNGTTWLPIPGGSNGQVLKFYNSIPVWASTASIPTIITDEATAITSTTAISGGNVSDGGAPITARGVCWSALVNPTISANFTNNGSGPGLFSSKLTDLTVATTYHIRAYATNSIGTAYGNDISFTTTSWVCGASTITINHVVTGGVAPEDKATTYGTVTNIPGEPTKCWITSNLGATNQAAAVNDASEAAAGWYFQFNRKQGYKHDGTTRIPATTWIGSISENSDWLPANDPCALELGSGWRLPTSTEWSNVDVTDGWTTWAGPYASGLKLHAAGYLFFSDGSLQARGSYGDNWSSKQYDASSGWYLGFGSGDSDMYIDGKTNGYTARCLKD